MPYINGQRHGTENHYDDLGNPIAEIVWRNDKKHGPSKFYSEETDEIEWFFNGQSVNAERFEVLENREKSSLISTATRGRPLHRASPIGLAL